MKAGPDCPAQASRPPMPGPLASAWVFWTGPSPGDEAGLRGVEAQSSQAAVTQAPVQLWAGRRNPPGAGRLTASQSLGCEHIYMDTGTAQNKQQMKDTGSWSGGGPPLRVMELTGQSTPCSHCYSQICGTWVLLFLFSRSTFPSHMMPRSSENVQ